MHKVTSCVCRGCKPNGLVAGGLDLVVVPGLAFTVLGHRLGRGKGYYDTFLARYRATLGALPLTVGLAFSQQVVPSVPTDENDVCLDVLLHGWNLRQIHMKEHFDLYLLFFSSHCLFRFTVYTEETILWAARRAPWTWWWGLQQYVHCWQ
jgi:hypothetical protein